MKRSTTITQDGPSESILLSNRDSSEWVLSVFSSSWGSMSVSLQASANNSDWFTADNISGQVSFTESGAVILTPGLYYRFVVSNYSNPISIDVKPTKTNF